jgi:hypothetical protein
MVEAMRRVAQAEEGGLGLLRGEGTLFYRRGQEDIHTDGIPKSPKGNLRGVQV